MVNRHDIDDFMNNGSFTDMNGLSVHSGDTVEYRFGQRQGVVASIHQDGDAYVDFYDTGKTECVKGHHLIRVQRFNDLITL